MNDIDYANIETYDGYCDEYCSSSNSIDYKEIPTAIKVYETNKAILLQDIDHVYGESYEVYKFWVPKKHIKENGGIYKIKRFVNINKIDIEMVENKWIYHNEWFVERKEITKDILEILRRQNDQARI
jgi:hypothetical protein